MSNISVIVPVYNVEKYIYRCVDSILNQTFKDFELILVDDGSPDNCGKICDEYAKKDVRVYVIHNENGGVSLARDLGIDYALTTDSKWITFIDSDDCVHKDYLKTLVDLVENFSAKISCCCAVSFVDESNIHSCHDGHNIYYDTPANLAMNEKMSITSPCCKLFRKELFDCVRFPIGKRFEDTYTVYKLLFKVEKIVSTDDELYFYYQNSNGFTCLSWDSNKFEEQFTAFRERLIFFAENNHMLLFKKHVREYIYWMIRCFFCLVNDNKNKDYLIKVYGDFFNFAKQYEEIIAFYELIEIYEKVWVENYKGCFREKFKNQFLYLKSTKGRFFAVLWFIKNYFKVYKGRLLFHRKLLKSNGINSKKLY